MDYYVGLTDFSDALEAMPMELIRHFTLLREIDAKCLTTRPLLWSLINQFLETPRTDALAQHREHLMARIRTLVRELMPCLEEKMHVAGVAADAVARHVTRLDHGFTIIEKYEIPALVRFGPPDHPAIVTDAKSSELARSAQSTRSETRREALAARKAARGHEDVDKRRGGDKRKKDASAASPAAPVVVSEPPVESAAATGNDDAVTGAVAGARTAESGYRTPDTGHRTSDPALPDTAQTDTSGDTELKHAHKRKDYDMGIARYADAEENHVYNSSAATWNAHEHADKRVRQRVRRGGSLRPKDMGQRTDEPVYCYCQQVSFGEMVGCDGPECKREWFHLDCLGLSSPPKGSWFCHECSRRGRRR